MKARDLIHILQEYGEDKEVRVVRPGTDPIEDPAISYPIRGVHIETVDPLEPGEPSPLGDITLGEIISLVLEMDYDQLKNFEKLVVPDSELWKPQEEVQDLRVMLLGTEAVPYRDMPVERFIVNNVEMFQKLVGGYFEMYQHALGPRVFNFYVNERGAGLDYTVTLDKIHYRGPMVITKPGPTGEDLSLTDDDVKFIHEYFRRKP